MSGSDFGDFLLPRPLKKDRFFFSFSAARLACKPVPIKAVGLSASGIARSEPVPRAAPSAELSSRSVESPSSILRGIPLTGVKLAGSSSSLESAKRLRRFLGPSSSSLESANRLEKRLVGPFAAAAFGLELLPKPGKRDGDFARRILVESIESRIELRIPGPELNGLRVLSPGDDVRAVIEEARPLMERGLSSTDDPRIERFMV